MSPGELAILCTAALLGGALNAVAGGGSFLTFPALLFAGVAPITANATSAVVLWPGSVASALGYRRALAGEGRLLAWLLPVSAAGGVVGAWWVLHTPPALFARVVPFLLLAATLIFTFGEPLRRALERRAKPGLPAALGLQAAISVYGGYFGGGMGLMMLAAFSLLGPKGLHTMNGLKSALGVAINLTALITFAVQGALDWRRAAVMVLASVAGGWGGARWAQRFDARNVKKAVVTLGWVMTALFFLRTYG